MCNAWNHPPGCRCGFGGDGHLGQSYGGGGYGGGYGAPTYDLHSPAGRLRVYTDSYVDPNARCPVCGAPVFFYQSPYGGRVFFDQLGWPWPKHPCTDNPRANAPLTGGDNSLLDRLYMQLREFDLPTTPVLVEQVIPKAPPKRPAPQQLHVVKPQQPGLADKLLEQGKAARREGRSQEAAKLFAKVVQIQPYHTGAWRHLAGVLTDNDERAFCLEKALLAAIRQHDFDQADQLRPIIRGIKATRFRRPAILKALDPPRLGLRKQPALPPARKQPAPSPVQKQPVPPPVKPASLPIDTATWTLVIRTAKGEQPIRWRLFTGPKRYEGVSARDLPPQTGLLTALIEGLHAARKLMGGAPTPLTVGCNAEQLIRQACGEAKAHNDHDQKLLTEVVALSKVMSKATFTVMTSAAVDRCLQE